MSVAPEFRFHHGGVSVPNLDEALDWYRDVLGFEVEKRFRIDGARADVAMIRRGPVRFELFRVDDATAMPDDRRYPDRDLQTHGNKHVAFRVDDLDDWLDYLKDKDADIALVVNESFGRGCFVRDCAGNLIEFVEEPDP